MRAARSAAPSSIAAAFALAACMTSCSSATPVGDLARPPAFEPKDQTKCSVTKSQARPLVVEWSPLDRAQLEDRAKRGLVAVRYVGCEMEILPACKVVGAYGYSALTRKRDRIVMKDADDLYANVPIGAARLEATLQKAGQLDVAMTIVGRYNADRLGASEVDLEGQCGDATHFVAALTVGAFELSAGAEAEIGGGAGIGPAGAGARSSARRELLNRDGDEKACEASTDEDKKPPSGCGAPLRVEVVPIGRRAGAPEPPPAEARAGSGAPPAARATSNAPSSPSPAAPAMGGPTLYERLGGLDTIRLVVDELLKRVVADARINARFASTDMKELRLRLIDQICAATGGPCRYMGKGLGDAHGGITLTAAELDAFMSDLRAALDAAKIGGPAKEDLATTVARLGG